MTKPTGKPKGHPPDGPLRDDADLYRLAYIWAMSIAPRSLLGAKSTERVGVRAASSAVAVLRDPAQPLDTAKARKLRKPGSMDFVASAKTGTHLGYAERLRKKLRRIRRDGSVEDHVLLGALGGAFIASTFVDLDKGQRVARDLCLAVGQGDWFTTSLEPFIESRKASLGHNGGPPL